MRMRKGLAKTWGDPGLQIGITVPRGAGVKAGTICLCLGMENGGAVQFESVDPVEEAIKSRSAWQRGLSREEREEIERGMSGFVFALSAVSLSFETQRRTTPVATSIAMEMGSDEELELDRERDLWQM